MSTLDDAQSVGDKVTVEACKRCHINTGGKVFSPYGTMTHAFKYGIDFVAEPYELTYDSGDGVMETATIDGDVHAAAGITCADCHFDRIHKVRYGQHNVAWGHDITPDTFSCNTAGCHPQLPHSASESILYPILDSHTKVLSCQTCHITHTGGLVYRDLRTPMAPLEGKHFYTFDDEVEYGVTPEYRWYNGTSGGWEGVLEGPCPIGPKGSKRGYRRGDGSKISPFKRYQAMVWFDIFVGQPVPYILKDFFVDGDLFAAANKGMEQSGWIPEGMNYNFGLRQGIGIVFGFPMVCPLQISHGIQTGENALGYDVESCTTCHSEGSTFWKYLGYTRRERKKLQNLW